MWHMLRYGFVHSSQWVFVTGYGFVDFESTDAAELAVKALQSRGIQAQMAKVNLSFVSNFLVNKL